MALDLKKSTLKYSGKHIRVSLLPQSDSFGINLAEWKFFFTFGTGRKIMVIDSVEVAWRVGEIKF